MLCYVYFFLHFFISFKYDFHVDAKRIVKREKCKEIFALMVKKNNVWHDTSFVGKNCQYLWVMVT